MRSNPTVEDIRAFTKHLLPPWTFTATNRFTGLKNQITTDKLKKAVKFVRVYAALKNDIHVKGVEHKTTADDFREMLLTYGDKYHFLVAFDPAKDFEIVRVLDTHSLKSEFTVQWFREWGDKYRLMTVRDPNSIKQIMETGQMPEEVKASLHEHL